MVVYPIAFLHSAFALDLAGRLMGKRRFYQVGQRFGAAGIAAGFLAAIPGMIDYLYTVPPRSSGKKRATKHLLVNSSAMALFGLAQYLRRRERGEPSVAVLGLEGAGVGLLTTGAWLGSTLVHRNFVGPDHRYAGAERFEEAQVPYWPGEPVVVAREDEMQVDQMKLLRVNGKRIVLARSEEGYTALDDRCTHRGGSLADGVMISGTVQCRWHGSQFDTATGAVCAGPATEPIRTYPVEVSEGEVRLLVGAEEAAPARGAGVSGPTGEKIPESIAAPTRWPSGRRAGTRNAGGTTETGS
jgi:nitrite reductase/ring-hydroxylating ferredoxin subunit/uncharacterized membrane protein